MNKFTKLASLTVISATVIVLFQNCGNNFELKDPSLLEQNLASMNAPHIFLSNAKAQANTDLSFSVSDGALSDLTSYNWSHELNGIKNNCSVRFSSSPSIYIVNCSSSGTLKVFVDIVDKGQSFAVSPYISSITQATSSTSTGGVDNTKTAAYYPNPANKLIINFDLPSGLGKTSWNTTSNIVEVFVGQTLVFRNLDSVRHALHTGGAPCAHTSTADPGQNFNCVITNTYDSLTVTSTVYDHVQGNLTKFYVKSYSPSDLYSQKCSSCHNSLPSSNKLGSTPSQIKSAIINNGSMKNLSSLTSLTERQIEAISMALGGL